MSKFVPIIQWPGPQGPTLPLVDSALDEYLVYTPRTQPALVYSTRQTIYKDTEDQALYGVVNRYLEAMSWIERMSWKNTGKGQQVYQYSFSSSFKITEGDEINAGFNMGATYAGMSIGLQTSIKVFKSTETTKSDTITVTINVPPDSQVILYQKRFNFRDNTTFINDAWGEEWNVGPFGGYSPLTTKTSTTEIYTEEYFTAAKPLEKGPGKMAVSTVKAAPRAAKTRKRENITKRAKDLIAALNI